jgi:DNA polymerase-3 subunit delta
MYLRNRCRTALIERALPADSRAEGLSRHDLDEVELSAVVDDARSFSLFARDRVIWVSSAESVLPKGRAASDEDGGSAKESAAELTAYLKSPTPGVVLVFDCARYDFDGDDKTRLQRVQKFYSAVPVHVEFQRLSASATRRIAQDLAKERGLKIGQAEIEQLVEALAFDAARVAMEMEKLSLYAGQERRITQEDIWNLVPDAKAASIFNLVAALGRGDRAASLQALDVLIREGEYLPLALAFLATQFRLALVAREARLTSSAQIQAYFTRQGTPMWRSRADQVAQTIQVFGEDKLRSALIKVYETDKALRDMRPDDRTMMEGLVFSLT